MGRRVLASPLKPWVASNDAQGVLKKKERDGVIHRDARSRFSKHRLQTLSDASTHDISVDHKMDSEPSQRLHQSGAITVNLSQSSFIVKRPYVGMMHVLVDRRDKIP